MASEKPHNKVSKKPRYFHRTIYVFMVLLGINLIWDIFANANKTPKHFLLGIIVTVGFSLFYFIIKNIKRYYIKKKNIKSKFLDSYAMVPFVYLCFMITFLLIINLSTIFTENPKEASNSLHEGLDLSGYSKHNYDNSYSNDFKNFVFFVNISMCKYAVYPLSSEHPDLIKRYQKENILDKQWVATSQLILLSFLCTFVMQLLAIFIAERLIYRSVRTKKKHGHHKKNKIITQPA